MYASTSLHCCYTMPQTCISPGPGAGELRFLLSVLFLLEDGCAFLCPLMAKILHFLLLMRSLIPPRKHSSLTSATEVNFQSTYSKYHQIVGYCFLTFLAGVVCLQVRSLSSQFYCHDRVRQVLVSNARLPFFLLQFCTEYKRISKLSLTMSWWYVQYL